MAPIKHNKSNHLLYRVWSNMKYRCYNKNCVKYEKYGGRGIKICDEWLNDFICFFDWAISNGYQIGLSIERINNDGDYEPSNCKWATPKEQGNNRTTNILFTYNNETKNLSQWSGGDKLLYKRLQERILVRGWDFEKALNTPTNEKCRNKRYKSKANPYPKALKKS